VTPGKASTEQRERVIAGLLWYGTWLASAVIALGLLVGTAQQQLAMSSPGGLSGPGLVRGGIALFISLPIARVGLMLLLFLHERDYTYMTLSALVLAIMAAGFVAGL